MAGMAGEQCRNRRAGCGWSLWKAHTGRRLDYEGLVEEALCFGWIDSRAEKLDADRSMIRFTPRRRGSGWSRTNKERIERLDRAGLMTDAGRAVIAAAKADGSWTLLDDVEALVVPEDLAEALASRPGARDRWEAFPPSARKAMLGWIAQAKRAPTRAARVTETAERAARGERAGQVRPVLVSEPEGSASRRAPRRARHRDDGRGSLWSQRPGTRTRDAAPGSPCSREISPTAGSTPRRSPNR